MSVKELEHYKRVRAAFEGPETGTGDNRRGEEEREAVTAGPMPTKSSDRPLPAISDRPPPTMSFVARESKDKGKGKGRAVDTEPNAKGKGRMVKEEEEEEEKKEQETKKQPTWDSSSDEDEAYETSDDFRTPERGASGTGSEVGMGFREQNLDDEEALYD